MISVNIQNIRRADAREYEHPTVAFSAVTLVTDQGDATIFLPAGTAAAVAACINVAVAAGQPAPKLEVVA